MSQSSTLLIGMDVHTESIAVAYVAQDHGAEGTDRGRLGTRQRDIDQRVRKMHSKAKRLIFVYDADPCGYWLSRYLSKKGSDCWGVAPSLIPPKPGDRVTTDRRDAVPLARLARAGDLTAVSVPTVAEEAIRALTRVRADALSALKDPTCRRTAFVRRHDIRYTGRAHWGAAHRRWHAEVVGPPPAPPSVFQEYVRAVQEQSARLQRLEQALQAHVTAWRWAPVIAALQALRGGPCTVAVTLVAAMGDLPRFDRPRALMKCLGLIPSAFSSGTHRRQGSMTKAGNTHARRVLVAGAWASRSPAQVSRHLQLRLEKQPTVIPDISGKAQGRRCTRYRRLVARGKHAHVVPVAIARELIGCMWAIAQAVPSVAEDHAGSGWHRGQQTVNATRCHGASAETPPRCGVTRGGVRRRGQETRAEREAGTRRTQGRWAPTHE